MQKKTQTYEAQDTSSKPKINIQDMDIRSCSLTTPVLTNATYSCLKQLKMAGEKKHANTRRF